jgi:hypothetical protein
MVAVVMASSSMFAPGMYLLWGGLCLCALLSALPGTPAKPFLKAVTVAGLLAAIAIAMPKVFAFYIPCSWVFWPFC